MNREDFESGNNLKKLENMMLMTGLVNNRVICKLQPMTGPMNNRVICKLQQMRSSWTGQQPNRYANARNGQ